MLTQVKNSFMVALALLLARLPLAKAHTTPRKRQTL
jgi:hypothetical protein